MKIFLDVEATEQNEIIAIGAVTDKDNKTFYSLVKPQFSELTPIIKKLTHINNEELKTAPLFNQAMTDLYQWLFSKEASVAEWRIYSYGNDSIFFKKTLRNCVYNLSYWLCCQIIATLQDVTQQTRQFFKSANNLQQVYNYIQQQEEKQQHNPLEDAQMLQMVMKYMDSHKPYEISPFINLTEAKKKNKTELPKGTYICQNLDCTIAKAACSMENMVKWMLSQPEYLHMPKEQQARPIRLANKIAEAAKKKQPYANRYWIKVEE